MHNETWFHSSTGIHGNIRGRVPPRFNIVVLERDILQYLKETYCSTERETYYSKERDVLYRRERRAYSP